MRLFFIVVAIMMALPPGRPVLAARGELPQTITVSYVDCSPGGGTVALDIIDYASGTDILHSSVNLGRTQAHTMTLNLKPGNYKVSFIRAGCNAQAQISVLEGHSRTIMLIGRALMRLSGLSGAIYGNVPGGMDNVSAVCSTTNGQATYDAIVDGGHTI